MVDLIEQNKSSPGSVSPANTPREAIPAHPDAGRPQEDKPNLPALAIEPQEEMSRAEKWYNRIVYSGLNYWLNLGISLYMTDVFKHGGKADFTRIFPKIGLTKTLGKDWYAAGVRGMTNKMQSTGMFAENSRIPNRIAEVGLGTFTLNSGGNLLLIPLKIIEDHKRQIVHWIKKHITKENLIAADGHEETPDEIYIEQEQPKQSWMRVIARRVLAVSSTIVTGLAMDNILRTKNPDGSTIDGQERFTGWITDGAQSVLKSGYVPKGAAIAENKFAKRYTGYLALDWMYTLITSKVMHWTNGAKKAKMPHEIGDPQSPAGDDKTLDQITLAKRAASASKVAATQEGIIPVLPEPEPRKRHPVKAKEKNLASYKKPSIVPAKDHVEVARRADDPHYSLSS